MGWLQMFVLILTLLIGGYLFGCLHGSLLAQKLSGVNLKEAGLKNAGASNAMIVLGKRFGVLVAVIDIGKGALAITLAKLLTVQAGLNEEVTWLLIFIAGAAVIFGHVFPFYMKFNGGKGTATVIGVLLTMDWRMGLIAFGLLIVISLLTDFLILGVFMLYLTLMTFSILFVPGLWTPFIALFLFLISFWKHIENLQRVRQGEEKRISTLFGKK